MICAAESGTAAEDEVCAPENKDGYQGDQENGQAIQTLDLEARSEVQILLRWSVRGFRFHGSRSSGDESAVDDLDPLAFATDADHELRPLEKTVDDVPGIPHAIVANPHPSARDLDEKGREI